MLTIVAWWLSLTLLGWLAFPIAYRFLHTLPDRGLTLSRALALLLWGFTFWILGTYGILENNGGGMVVALLMLAGLSYWSWRKISRGEMAAWFQANRTLVLVVEGLFLLAFLGMTYVRAANPDLSSTEKPMELAFLNAILRSPAMPPHDPWLSGYSISYYYFGYVMVSMLARITGASGGVAFALGVSMVFAMTAIAAYGLAYNLLTLRRPSTVYANRWAALFAPVMVLVLGNVEGLLEILHARHQFWTINAAGEQVSSFWSWLGIRDLVNPPIAEISWLPRTYGSGAWWWWRASRVINDLTFSGAPQEVISEIPSFSFVLGDLHPHILSMPFVFLATALGLHMHLGGADGSEPFWLGLRIRPRYLLLSAVVLGGLAFINIWDLPIYLMLFVILYAFHRAALDGWAFERIGDFVAILLVLGLGSVFLYLPFYLGFSSQAGGILPNLLNPTRGVHLWVHFGTLLAPLLIFILWQWTKDWDSRRFLNGLVLALGFGLGLWLFSLGLAWLYATLLAGTNLGDAVLFSLGAPDLPSLFSESMHRRLVDSGGWITLILLLGLLLGRLWTRPENPQSRAKAANERESADQFLLLLALFGALFVLVPEFIFLRDQFGIRMNTVFKFYFQAWQMWAVIAAVALIIFWREWSGLRRALALGLASLVLAVGLVYPVFAISDRIRHPEDQILALPDGSRRLTADELAAIAWLQDEELAPLAEAVGNSYSPAGHARIATHSGQMAVIGWPGHEGQWRAGSVEFAGRIGDMETFYSSSNWQITRQIADLYDIRFVVIGPLERSTYTVNESKFESNLELGFRSGNVSIYLMP